MIVTNSIGDSTHSLLLARKIDNGDINKDDNKVIDVTGTINNDFFFLLIKIDRCKSEAINMVSTNYLWGIWIIIITMMDKCDIWLINWKRMKAQMRMKQSGGHNLRWNCGFIHSFTCDRPLTAHQTCCLYYLDLDLLLLFMYPYYVSFIIIIVFYFQIYKWPGLNLLHDRCKTLIKF